MLPLTQEKQGAIRPLELRNASTIGHYRVLTELERRHATVVYKALDPQHDRLVALKVILADNLQGERLRSFREDMRREASITARLTDPRIVPILDSGEDPDGNPYIVMEFVEGETLEQALTNSKNGAPVAFGTRLDIAIEIARLLDYIHSRGVVHRDITPSNILLTKQFHVRIVDFGIATLIQEEHSTDGVLPGTPAFVAPELLNDSPANARSDIFSFGVLLYWMFTGEVPFSGDTVTEIVHKVANVDPLPVRCRNWALPDEVDRILGKCLAKNPAQRYGAARELGCELASLRYEMTSVIKNREIGRQVVEEDAAIVQHICEPLARELDRLQATYSSLSERLGASGKQFRESETPIPEDLITDLSEFKKGVADLSKMVADLGKEMSLSTTLPVGTLDDLRRSIETIAQAEQQRTKAIEAILENLGPVAREIDGTASPTAQNEFHAIHPLARPSVLGLNETVCQTRPTSEAVSSSALQYTGARRRVALATLAFGVVACVAYAVMKFHLAAPAPPVSTIAVPDLEIRPRSDQLLRDSPNLNVSPKPAVGVQVASPPPEIRLKPKPSPLSKEISSGSSLAPIAKQVVTSKGEPEPPSLLSGPSATSDRIGNVSGNVLAALARPVIPVLAPPPPERIRIGGQLAAAKLVSQTRLTYPPMARQYHIQGTIQLEAVINKDGTVEKLVVISGPALLRQAAIEAVKQWRYQPTLLNGEPVEVITNVSVNFKLDG